MYKDYRMIIAGQAGASSAAMKKVPERNGNYSGPKRLSLRCPKGAVSTSGAAISEYLL